MNPTLTWEKVGDTFYRTFQGAALKWAVKIEESCLVAAPNAGAIAVWDRYGAIRSLDGVSSKKSRIELLVYSGSGDLLATLPWDLGEICSVGWTNDEKLIVVASNGGIRVYSDFEGNFEQLRLELPATAAQFHAHGAVIEHEDCFTVLLLTTSTRIINLDKPKHSTLTSWCILPGPKLRPRELALLLASAPSQTDVTKITSIGISGHQSLHNVPLPSSETTVTSITCSESGNYIALHLSTGTVYVYTRNFDHLVSQSCGNPIETSARPTWCGESSLIFPLLPDSISEADHNDETRIPPTDEAIILNVKSGDQSLSLYDLPVLFSAETDSVRIFTSHTHDIFAAVPPKTADIYRIGSSSSSAVLFSSIDLLAENPAKAYENLSMIGRDKIAEAVSDCCDAVLLEMDVKSQKRLLQAASLGKSSYPLCDSSKYLRAVERLRLLNNLREGQAEMLITSEQVDNMGNQELIRRLQSRKLFALAFACCEFLKLPVEPVYESWAISKIKQCVELNDDELLDILDTKIKSHKTLSFATIGKKAFLDGRIALAKTLAEREQNQREKMELLLDMKEYQQALQASADSGDMDLIYSVILSAQDTLSLPQLYRAFNDNKLIISAYTDLLKASSDSELEGMQKVHEFFYQMDLKMEDLQSRLKFANSTPNLSVDEQIIELSSVLKGYKEVRNGAFNVRMLDDHIRLLRLQQKLESDYERDFTGLSVVDTISALLHISQVHSAQKLKQQFKIPDHQWTALRMKALVLKRDWDGLWDFAQDVKAVSFYGMFYQETKNAGNLRAAAQYALLSTDKPVVERIEMLLAVNAAREALPLAEKSRDPVLIGKVKTKLRSS